MRGGVQLSLTWVPYARVPGCKWAILDEFSNLRASGGPDEWEWVENMAHEPQGFVDVFFKGLQLTWTTVDNERFAYRKLFRDA